MKSKKYSISRIALFITALILTAPTPGLGQNLIPLPVRVESRVGAFTISPQTVIVAGQWPDLAAYLSQQIENACGFRPEVAVQQPADNYISLQSGKSLTPEAYTLEIAPERITIAGGDRGGAFYGLQTLFQLMPPEVYDSGKVGYKGFGTDSSLTLNAIYIEDSPRFAYRGAMLDVSRTYADKQTVIRYIDWLGAHKINRFHWHLTDDNGWRIEIKKYPLLTERGAWRGPGEALPPAYGSGQQRYGGYYTQDDIREIVRYAAFRNIEIIPEIDLPGHSQALTASYPDTFCPINPDAGEAPEEGATGNEEVTGNVLCAAREENFTMLRDIVHEVAALFPSAYIHLGGDEVTLKYWKACPRCRALMKQKGMESTRELFDYFILRLDEIAHAEGKKCMFWDEAITSNGLSASTTISGWRDVKTCRKVLERGLPLVVMPASYTYLDMKQNAFDRGHTWAWLVDTRRVYSLEPREILPANSDKNEYVRGIEVPLWAELLDRPQRFLEYQAYPRICAAAEVGWSRPEMRDWKDFYTRLTTGHLPRLDAMGIAYHLFPPKAIYDRGVITASTDISGATIRYTTDGSDPGTNSPLYNGPINDSLAENYRFRSFREGRFSTSIPPAAVSDTLLHASNRCVMTLPLSRYVDRNGVWYLRITPTEPDLMINQMTVSGPDTSYSIIRNGQRVSPFSDLRLYMDDRNRTADLIVTLSNNSSSASAISFSLRPSPYIEPATTLTSSLSFSTRFPARYSTDYNYTTYSRTARACQKGDWVLYTFAEPVVCGPITVKTGIPNVTRYIVTQGKVEYTTDGTTFELAGPLDSSGSITFSPQKPIKAVRISIEGENGEALVALQPLRLHRP